MKIVQRFVTHEKSVHDFVLSMADKYPGTFTDVWIFPHFDFPKLERHRETVAVLKPLFKQYREKNIKVSLQLLSIGDGLWLSAGDFSGVLYEGSEIQPAVGHDGSMPGYHFCWNNEAFRKYLSEMLEYYTSELKPDEIWFDDDLNNSRDSVKFGCFCEGCIAKFNKKHGTNYTQAEIMREFTYGDGGMRSMYGEFAIDSLGEFAETLAAAIKRGCPDTVACLQSGAKNYDVSPILEGLYKGCGHVPMYRAGAGVYRDHNPNLLLTKLQLSSIQHAGLADYVTCRCPEIENLMSHAMGKSVYGTVLEAALELASGATAISIALFNVANTMTEPERFYERFFKMFHQCLPYLEHLRDVSEKSVSGAVGALSPKRPFMKKFAEDETVTSFGKAAYNEMPELLRIGIPIAFDTAPDGVFILHPNVAANMEDCEISELLCKNVITDTKTAIMLKKRGFDLGIEAYECPYSECLKFTESYTSHPAAKSQRGNYSADCLYPRANDVCNITSLPEGGEIVGAYTFRDKSEPITEMENAPFGCATAVINLPSGGKWALIGYGLWRGNVSSARRDLLLDLADYISNKAVAARSYGEYQCYLIPRISKETGRTLAVSYLNCTIEPQTDIELVIRRPESERFVLSGQHSEAEALEFTKNGDEYTVRIPSLAAWDVVTVFCDK